MKNKHSIVLFGLILSIGFVLAWWGGAQTNTSAKRPVTGGSNPGLDRLVALVSYLEAHNETNALRLFNEYSNASLAQQNAADMGVKLHVLTALREGRTNDAIGLLEITLDGDIVGFAASYRELPASEQQWLGLGSLADARWYREKFPRKDALGGVAHAFELLDKSAK